MTSSDFWSIVNSAQVSTALFLIAISLVYIAFRLFKKDYLKAAKTTSR